MDLSKASLELDSLLLMTIDLESSDEDDEKRERFSNPYKTNKK